MTGASLLYSEIDEELRATVRRLLADRADWQTVLTLTDSERPYDLGLWRGMVDLGLTGLAVPEEHGGAGASLREVAVVMEELGRSVAPTAFLGSGVLATTALLAPGLPASDEVAGLLGRLSDGTARAALAVPLSTLPGAPLAATVRADGGTLTGSVTSVGDAEGADVLLVPAARGDQLGLYLVDAPDARVDPFLTLDLTRRLAHVTLESAPARPVATGEAALAAVDGALQAAAAMLACEQLGLAERCLELTVEHLKTRFQFGRPLGSFQALKHRLADLWVAVAQARATARYAVDRVAGGGHDDVEIAIAVAVAQAHCSPVAVRAAEECVQLHGGLGFTWEHPAHLFLKRARSDALAFGTADRHRSRLAELVGLPVT